MSRTRFDHVKCGVAQALEQLGDWWTLLIIRNAMMGATRFSEFEETLGIAKNVLSNRLAKLVDNGIFEKERLDEPGLRYAYTLTKKGRDLWILLTAMRLWSDKWVFGEDSVPMKLRERDTGREVAALLAVDADGNTLDAANLEWAKGPGWSDDFGAPEHLLAEIESKKPTRGRAKTRRQNTKKERQI